MAPPLPSLDEIRQLPLALTASVADDFIDINGHMNIRHYLELGAEAANQVIIGIGVDEEYHARDRRGVFAAEHHLRYYSELRAGEQMALHVRTLDRSTTAAHMLVFLVDQTNKRLANTLEVVMIHVDLDTRRPVPMSGRVAAGFDRLLAESALDWPAPVCGAMGIRR